MKIKLITLYNQLKSKFKRKKKVKLTAENFWDTDLVDIESKFLPKGKKITDLPVAVDYRIMSGKDVLVNNSLNVKYANND